MSIFPEKELDKMPSSRLIRKEDVEENGVVDFQCLEDERSTIPDPWVAANHTPAWYRMLSSRQGESEEGVVTTPSTGKRCGPFNESLGAGWLLRAPERIELVKEDEEVSVSNDATEFVTVLSTENEDSGSNSKFYKPDVLVDMRWAVNVPDGYGVLITPALNRPEPDFEPMSYYHVPTGKTEDQPFVELAAYMWEDEVTIEKGEPMVSVVPFPDTTIPKRAQVGPLTNGCSVRRVQKRNDNRLGVRPSFYRKEIWCPRVGTELRDVETEANRRQSEAESDDVASRQSDESGEHTDCDAIEEERKVRFDEFDSFEEVYGEEAETTTRLGLEVPTVPEGWVEFLCRDSYYGAIPRPASSTQFIQPWHREMSSAIPSVAESEFPIHESVIRAMSIGFVVRNDTDLSLKKDTEAQGRYRASAKGPDDLNPATVQDDRIIGKQHPDMPMSITNVNSRWLFRSAPGVSSLFLSPMNHFQSRYRSFSGLVETDDWYGFLNVPGRLDNDAEKVVLPRGLPLIQVIPYERGKEILSGKITHRDTDGRTKAGGAR